MTDNHDAEDPSSLRPLGSAEHSVDSLSRNAASYSLVGLRLRSQTPTSIHVSSTGGVDDGLTRPRCLWREHPRSARHPGNDRFLRIPASRGRRQAVIGVGYDP